VLTVDHTSGGIVLHGVTSGSALCACLEVDSGHLIDRVTVT